MSLSVPLFRSFLCFFCLSVFALFFFFFFFFFLVLGYGLQHVAEDVL